MYNYNELQAVELSPTKKDYYQIWSELIDVAGKLSSRWDPSATNESDPGIVLLKVLTAIADKLAYNIDANTLEAFMPSAAQESSMRKLCEMLGYNMQYYKSATTKVRITYRGDVWPSSNGGVITIDRFTNIKDSNSKINYITLNPVFLSVGTPSVIVDCIEGELVTCQTENGQVVTLSHLDDNNRFYLPEQRVASNNNCVFVANVTSPVDFWTSTDNLNTQLLGERVYQFGFDSRLGLPYIKFPDDISELIGEGLYISFIRTQGIGGNISVNQLQQMEKPASWSDPVTEEDEDTITAADVVQGTQEEDTSWTDVTLYSVTNLSRATNGRNPETIDEAYWNYQKTIGTFDTLVTCRDYMNKIYQLTKTDVDSTPLVSNIIVSDIRDDINRAYTVCAYTTQGLEYQHIPETHNGEDRIKYFDLILYPFETIYGTNTQSEFITSFTYTDKIALNKFETELEQNKTIAHRFRLPELINNADDPSKAIDDIACIKIYFRLSARLATTSKVSELEAIEIEQVAHTALYKAFNMRNMTFGDELPYDSILKTLTYADPRIKNVILDDPKLYVVACLVSGKEIPIIDASHEYASIDEAKTAMRYYRDLVLKNVLAGKVALFNFNKDFAHEFEDSIYPEGSSVLNATYSVVNPATESDILELANPTVGFEVLNNVLYTKANPNKVFKRLAFTKATTGTLQIHLQRAATKAFRSAFHLVNTINIDLYTPGANTPRYKIEFTPDYLNPTTAILPDKLTTQVYNCCTGIAVKEDLDQIPYFGVMPTASLTALDALTPESEGNPVSTQLCQIPFNTTAIDDQNIIFDKVCIYADVKTDYINSENSNASDSDIQSLLALAREAFDTIKFEFEWCSPDSELLDDPDGKQYESIEKKITPDSDGALTLLWPGTTISNTDLTPSLDTALSGESIDLVAAGSTLKTIGQFVFTAIRDDDIFNKLETIGADPAQYVALNLKTTNGDRLATPVLLKFKSHCIDEGAPDISEDGTRVTITIRESAQRLTTKSFKVKDLLSFAHEFATEDESLNKLNLKVLKHQDCAAITVYSLATGTLESTDTTADNTIKLLYKITTPGNWQAEFYESETISTPVCSYVIGALAHAFVAREVVFKQVDGSWYYCDRFNNQLQYAITDADFKLLSEDSFKFTQSAKQYASFAHDEDWEVTDEAKIEPAPTLAYKPIITPEEFITDNADIVYYDMETNTLMQEKAAITGVTKITSDLVVHPDRISEKDSLTLSRHEVVQFRAPNFKTTATYPAYVNYYVKLNPVTDAVTSSASGRTAKSTAAVPATMWSLLDFLNGGITEAFKKSEDDACYYIYTALDADGKAIDPYNQLIHAGNDTAAWSRRKSWREKVNSMPASLLKNIWTTTTSREGSYEEAAARNNYETYTKQYGGLLVDSGSGYELFELPNNFEESQIGIPAGLQFYVVYITEANFGDFVQWLQGNAGNITYRTADTYTELSSKALIQGIYSQSRPSLSRKFGNLVDISRFKYTYVDSYGGTPSTALHTYYVPQLWASTTTSHTANGLGVDAKSAGVTANAEYLLKDGEFMLLTYSTSEGREDGSTVVKNIALGPGQIIKANFELIDSAEKAMVTKYSKTNNYGPWELNTGTTTRTILPAEVPGMYAFGATEQVEVREQIEVTLDESQTYLYWEIDPSNKVVREANGVAYEYFPFDDLTSEGKYILQHGEYLFYTNEAKEGVAYYGAGSEIRRSKSAPPIRRIDKEYKISAEEAANVGFAAVVPWEQFLLSKDKTITIAEYQIINLTEGDTLFELDMEEEGVTLHNAFEKVKGAKYRCNGLDAELPELALTNISWEARGKLELNLGSKQPQSLTVHRSANGLELARAMITLNGTIKKTVNNADTIEEKPIYTLTPQMVEAGSPPADMAIYANAALVGPDGGFAFTPKYLEDNGYPSFKLCERIDLTTDFEAAAEDPIPSEPCTLAFDTDLAFANYDLSYESGATAKTLPLNVVLEDSHFGLLTVYLLDTTETTVDTTKKVSLALEVKNSEASNELSIFNNLKSGTTNLTSPKVAEDKIIEKFAWWDNSTEYVLKAGLNVVVIPSSGTLTIKAENTTAGDVLMIGKLKTVPYRNQLNPQLAFASHNSYDSSLKFVVKDENGEKASYMVQTNEVYDWLRSKVANTDFYYTYEPNNISGLDLNAADPTDTLAVAKNWFDSQNIVNKFVVSQLDAAYLEQFIGVSKFSKL